MPKGTAKKRFAVGAKVRVIMPGVDGIVVAAGDTLAALAEYWHKIQTENGVRNEPGCNLELIPTPVGSESRESSNMALHNQLVEYFRSLEQALDEHRQKGTLTGDPVYQKSYDQLTSDLARIGYGQDHIEEVAAQCGHGSTLARLQKLCKKPIGFSSGKS